MNNILPLKHKIIVIGDLHADFNKTKDIFIKLKLIDDNNRWQANPPDTVVVQLGDQVDGGGRGHHFIDGEMDVIDFLDNIHSQASLYGGGVYSLLGNHELMNFMGDYNYTAPNDLYEKRQHFKFGTPFAKKLANNRRVIMKIGPFLFLHAGILSNHFEKDSNINSELFINKVNSLMKKLLNNEIAPNDPLIDKFFTSSNSLLWTRKLGGDKVDCDDIDKVTNYLNVGHVFVGHTVQSEINSKCNNKIWRLDVGISDAFGDGGKIQVLEINSSDNTPPQFKVINL